MFERDFAALERLWSDDLAVNTPRNEVAADRSALLALFAKGVATYRTFERRIE